ncbi:MAG TPA: hypothetical protein VFC63_20625 [Blastocatellia bacterium]|nr:hypothetical protein [Blastocatellia bacterium]
MHIRLSISLLIICVLAVFAHGQSIPGQDQSNADAQAAQKELEKKALDFLEEVLSETQTLRLPENKAQVLASAAEILWTRDEKRARSLFSESVTNIAQVVARESYDYPFINNRTVAYNLRAQILQMIARHDPSLARDFLVATHQPVIDQGSITSDLDSQLEMQFAALIAQRDPKQALQMAEDNLAKGLTQDAVNALQSLLKVDKDAGNKFLDDIVKKVKSQDLATNNQALSVALSLLQTIGRSSTASPSGSSNGTSASTAPPAPSQLNSGSNPGSQVQYNEQAVKDLAEYVVKSVQILISNTSFNPLTLNNQVNVYSYFSRVQQMLPILDKYAPAQTADLRAKIAQFTNKLDDRSRTMAEFQNLQANGGSTDVLLEAASKAPVEVRSSMYSMIAGKMAKDGDIDKARQLINDNVTDANAKKSALSNLDNLVIAADIQKGKVNEARQLIAQSKSDEDKIPLLLQLSTMMLKTDKKSALELLDEAHGILGNRIDNIGDMTLQIRIVTAYSQIDPAKGLEVMELVIDQVNSIVTAAQIVDSFQTFGFRSFRDGELIIGNENVNFSSNLVRQCSNTLSRTAKIDFDRTRATADKFTRVDAKVMTHLAIAQAVLSKPADSVQAKQ